MTKKAKTFWGIFSLVVPGATFIIVLIAYAIANFVISALAAGGGSELASTIGSLINVALGILGILSMIGVPIGLVIGLILLLTRDEEGKKIEENTKTEEKIDVV